MKKTNLCNLFTSIAMIMVLEQNGKTREEAEKEVAEAMYEYIKPQIISMKKIASHGWFVKFLPTHKCIYQQLFVKYGMPEMTARFCRVDDILYSDLPRAKFIYTEQIGNGGSMCDYSYKKR